MGSLANRIGVVTGASSGIGEAVARQLVAGGCRVVVNARRRERLDQVVNELNRGASQPRAVGVAGDAADQGTIVAMLDAAASHFGGEADAVIANAGRGLSGSVFTSDPDQWEEMIRTNLLGLARLIREAAKRMVAQVDKAPSGAWLKQPRDIVLLGSSVGRHISPFSSMYGSTKFAVHSLGEALRREVGPKGIRVTVIQPAVVQSEFQAVAGYDATNFGAFMEKIGPVLEPVDVARTIAFALEQPPNVHLYDIGMRPTRQDYP